MLTCDQLSKRDSSFNQRQSSLRKLLIIFRGCAQMPRALALGLMGDLEILFEHHIWATRTLIEHCQTLTPEQLALTTPGTYGAIIPTITHIIAEDQRLLQRLTGEQVDVPVTEDSTFTLGDLQEIWAEQSERWRTVLAKIDTIDVTLPPRGPWPAVPGARSLILLEAIQHSNDHRTHVCSVLGAHGLPIHFLCGWMFWRSTGRVRPTDSISA